VLGALAAAGIGAVLAREQLQRRAARRSRHPVAAREPSLHPHEPLVTGMRRVALEQLDLAIELLEAPAKTTRADAVHETRKSLKRLRALLKLLRADLGEQRFGHENAVLRNSARELSQARDTAVLVDTLDDLLERFPAELGARKGVRRLRSGLTARRERSGVRAEAVASVLDELRASRLRLYAWDPGHCGEEHVIAGLERSYRQGRRRWRVARRSRPGRPGHAVAMHEWRKRAKDLRYCAETFGLGGVARRAERLGDTLGEDHDLALLDALVRDHGGRLGAGPASRKALRKAIAKRRRRLRRRALARGAELYAGKPKRWIDRMRGKFPKAE
jgi:CHAD domain-containing protein